MEDRAAAEHEEETLNEAEETRKTGEAAQEEASEIPIEGAASEENEEKKEEKTSETSGEEKKDLEADVILLQKQVKEAEQKTADLTDRYKRTLAEYENFRKRTEKEKEDLYSFAVKDVITKILPALDSLERGADGIPEEKKDDPIAKGMEQTIKQFQKALGEIGVEEIEARGKTFDPQLHNAVMHVEDDAFGEDEIVEVFQKGYTYKGTVVRHSMVKVAN